MNYADLGTERKPHPHGNTAAMVEAFQRGAAENGHTVTVVNVCQKKIAEHKLQMKLVM